MNASSSPAPGLSIVVVPFGGELLLERCLDALEGQTARDRVEIVVGGDDRVDFEALRRRFPAVRFARLAGERTPAEIRAAAVRRGRAPLVAITEAQCAPDREWAANILAAHRAERVAIGGVVDKDEGSVLGWALYFCDYARYAPPLAAGPVDALTDCNVSYKRPELESIADLWRAELHEPTVHAALAARGHRLWLEPQIVVRHLRAPGLGEAILDRYRFGRLFAATRAAGVGTARRWLLAAAAPLVPALVVARAARQMLRRRRHLARLLVALPAMLLLASVWAGGELVGTVSGHPGALAAGAPARESEG